MLRLTGVSKNPADEFHAATVESLSVDARKPLIAPRVGRLLRPDGRRPARLRRVRAGEARRRARGDRPRAGRARSRCADGASSSGAVALVAVATAPYTPISSSSPSVADVTAQPGGGEVASFVSASSSAPSPISIGCLPKCEKIARGIP